MTTTAPRPQVLSANGTHTIKITHDDVTIRGLDVYGATNNWEQAGIYIYNATGCFIENNRAGWDAGHQSYNGIRVHYWEAGYNTLSNNTCSYNTNYGIFLHNSFIGNNIVTGNTCAYNGAHGMQLDECWYNTLSNNNASHNLNSGIQVWISDYNVVKNKHLFPQRRFGRGG